MIYTIGKNKITVRENGQFSVSDGINVAPQTNRPNFEINIDGSHCIELDKMTFGGGTESDGALVLTYT